MIVVGGEALIDLILHQDGRVSAVPGGGPFNTARTIGRLGLSVGFVGSLSTDRFGTLLHDRLVTDGVIDDLTLRTDAPTTLAVAELDDAGGASYRFYTAATSAVALDAGQLPAFGSVGGRPLTPTAIHVGTLGLVLDGLADAMEALVAGASDDAVVMVDPNARPAATSDRGAWLGRLSRVLRRADIVKVSTDDLAWMRPTADPDRAAMGFLDDAPETERLLEIVTEAFADMEETGLELRRTDGLWYVSPTTTMTEAVLNVLRALDTGLIESVQVVYNVFDQNPEDELFPACQENNIAVIARVPFDEGSLAGALTETSSFPEGDFRRIYFGPENLEPTLERVAALRPLVPHGSSLPELALRFILSEPRVSTVIPGMRRLPHVRANVAAAERGPLDSAIVTALRDHRWDRQPSSWSL